MRLKALTWTAPDGSPRYFFDDLFPETLAERARSQRGARIVEVEVREVSDTVLDLDGCALALGTVGAPEDA